MIRSPSKDLPRIAALLIIFLGNLVFFLPFLFSGEQQTIGAESGDLPSFFKPMREFAAAELASGNFPLWNPYSSGGHPFIADPETALLYPFTYLFIILPSHLAFSWNYFIHYLICGYGLFFLCRCFRISNAGSLTGVFIYLFSAPHLLHLYAGHFTMINTMAWTPWLFWSLKRFLSTLSWRHAAGFGLFLGMHLLGGFPQYTYLVGWAILAYGLNASLSHNLFSKFGKIFFRLGCTIILGAGLFLTQATLAKELVDHSTRQKNDFSFSSSFSISKENLITLFIPKYYGETTAKEHDPSTYFGKTILWENSCYMGVASLLIFFSALGEWKKSFIRFWLFVFLTSFIIATGPLTPFFKICYEYLPGFSLFRGYSKALTITCLAFAILAGKGLDKITTRSGGIFEKISFLGFPIILAGLCLTSLTIPESLPFWKDLLLQQLEAWRLPPDPDRINNHFIAIQRNLFLVTIITLLAACFYQLREKISPLSRHFSSIFCLLVFCDFFVYAKPYFSPLDFKKFTIPDPIINPIVKKPLWTRTIHTHPVVANLGFSDNIPAVGGFENFTLKQYAKLASHFNGVSLNNKNHYLAIRPTPQNMNFYAAEYFLSDRKPPFPMNKIVSGNIGGGVPWVLYKKPGETSRYHIAQNIMPFPIGTDEDYLQPKRFAKFAQIMYWSYPETVFVSPDIYRRIFAQKLNNLKSSGAKGYVQVIIENTNCVVLQVDLSTPGILIVNENYYPGWRSRIDGVDTEVFPVNLIMKGIKVPSGNHQIKFYFVPTHFYANMLVSLFSFLTLSMLTIFNPKEKGLR